jgi:hypothetical protein
MRIPIKRRFIAFIEQGELTDRDSLVIETNLIEFASRGVFVSLGLACWVANSATLGCHHQPSSSSDSPISHSCHPINSPSLSNPILRLSFTTSSRQPTRTIASSIRSSFVESARFLPPPGPPTSAFEPTHNQSPRSLQSHCRDIYRSTVLDGFHEEGVLGLSGVGTIIITPGSHPHPPNRSEPSPHSFTTSDGTIVRIHLCQRYISEYSNTAPCPSTTLSNPTACMKEIASILEDAQYERGQFQHSQCQ